jgi:monoterpene epsilon-lactone hydrolase
MDPIREMYGRWAAGDMGQDDQWGDVTAEPRGVDYREVSADGVPAMWLEPHGAAEAYAGCSAPSTTPRTWCRRRICER